MKRQTIRSYVEAVHPGLEATPDVDAQLIETSKANAKYCYDGYKAYQPTSKEMKRVVDEALPCCRPGSGG